MARKCHALQKAARGAILVTQAPPEAILVTQAPRCAERPPSNAGGHNGPTAGWKPMTSTRLFCGIASHGGRFLTPCFKLLPPYSSAFPLPCFLAPMAILTCGPLVSSWLGSSRLTAACHRIWGCWGRGQRDFIGKRNSLKCPSSHPPL